MHICAGTDPDSLQAGMLDHLAVGIVDLDAPVLVFVPCPLKLGGLAAAHSNNASVRYAVEEGSYMAFAHAAEAGHGDGDLDILLEGHREVLEFVDYKTALESRFEVSCAISSGLCGPSYTKYRELLF